MLKDKLRPEKSLWMRFRTGVQLPSSPPCKDAYFDTMGIEICVLIFCLKPPETAEFITLLRKAPPPPWQKTGLEAVLFAFLGPLVSQSTVLLWWLPSNSEGERPGLTKATVKQWSYRTLMLAIVLL